MWCFLSMMQLYSQREFFSALLHRNCLFKVENFPYLDSWLCYWTLALSKSVSDVEQESRGGVKGREAHLGFSAEM